MRRCSAKPTERIGDRGYRRSSWGVALPSSGKGNTYGDTNSAVTGTPVGYGTDEGYFKNGGARSNRRGSRASYHSLDSSGWGLTSDEGGDGETSHRRWRWDRLLVRGTRLNRLYRRLCRNQEIVPLILWVVSFAKRMSASATVEGQRGTTNVDRRACLPLLLPTGGSGSSFVLSWWAFLFILFFKYIRSVVQWRGLGASSDGNQRCTRQSSHRNLTRVSPPLSATFLPHSRLLFPGSSVL